MSKDKNEGNSCSRDFYFHQVSSTVEVNNKILENQNAMPK